MTECHQCTHWRRLKHWRAFGLCKRFQTFKINVLDSREVLSMVPSAHPENHGLPTDGVITGFAFGCNQFEAKA